MKVVLAMSGGMDSTTLFCYLRENFKEVLPFQFQYGSKHNKWEYRVIERLGPYLETPIQIIPMHTPFQFIQSNLMATGSDVPEGHYNNANMSLTVVPGRNTIFASVLLGIAESIGAGFVALGVHRGDHFIYPDCRKEYIDSLNETFLLASDGKVGVIAPFINDDKISIIKRGIDLAVPYHLTRTCYKDQPIACGKCGSCQERLAAFEANGLEDPIEYESRVIMEAE